MKEAHWLWLMVLFAPLALAGCTEASKDTPQANGRKDSVVEKSSAQQEEAEIQTNLANLSPEDRKLAEAQRFCAVENENRLGSMGQPFRLLVKDQPVFLCCKGCAKKAERDADKTLANVRALSARSSPLQKN